MSQPENLFHRIMLKLRATGGAAVMIVWCLSFAAIAIWSDEPSLALGIMTFMGTTILWNIDRFGK